MTELLADIPTGRANAKMRKALSGIARRVAVAALTQGRDDVLMEVYCAGIAHAADSINRSKEPAE